MTSFEILLNNVTRLTGNVSSEVIENSGFDFHSDERALIINLATRIEMDNRRCLEWYTGDPIVSLGGLTAAELVSLGRGTKVISFLRRVEYLDVGRFAAF
jgi:hypothetical protein